MPAFAGGFLYLLGVIVTTVTLSSAPVVGLLQGVAPALRGEPKPAESPRALEVKFISDHAFAVIAGSTLVAVAIAVLTLVLTFLFDAVHFRRPEAWRAARPLVLVGGVGFVILSLFHEVLRAIKTHEFASGKDHTIHAADRALLLTGTTGVVVATLAFLCALMLALGMIAVMVGAMRTGLLTRWLGVVGIFSGAFFVPLFQSATLQVIAAFWLAAMGMLYIGKWPNGQPPAWESGEARPWPTRAQMREAGPRSQPALATGAGDVTPAPAKPKPAGSSRKRRKRGARG
ncbi:MAG TPA: hypothetical protein VK605_07425 [Solirubrobacteraceae bacterium]|nr:hypothetical protein [Solirubrobacteraceae bacterium]